MSRSGLRVLTDAAVIVWVALWIWAGVAVDHEVRRLATLGDTAASLGQSITDVGRTLNGIPLIGGDVSGAVEHAGRDATSSAHAARDSTRRVGLLLGLLIALVPTTPLLLGYLPRRVAAERDRLALRRVLAAGGGDALDELLALRAIAHLPFRELERLSADPVADLRAGRHAALADAELARLQLPSRRR
jgi:hypothetical protein